jgi:hypothetical protein
MLNDRFEWHIHNSMTSPETFEFEGLLQCCTDRRISAMSGRAYNRNC